MRRSETRSHGLRGRPGSMQKRTKAGGMKVEKNRRRFFWWPWGQKKATLSGTECRQRSEQAISSRIWGSGWDSVVWTVACARVCRPRGRNLGRLGFWKRGGIPTRPWVVVETERRLRGSVSTGKRSEGRTNGRGEVHGGCLGGKDGDCVDNHTMSIADNLGMVSKFSTT